MNNFKLNDIGFLVETFYEKGNHETITVDMLLGTDIFQYMSSVTWKEVLLCGTCLVVKNKVALMGTVNIIFS